MVDQQFAGPLSGVTIVDLSMWWSGPLATQLFALMGATVLKVESVQRIDGWRIAGRGTSEDSAHERAANFNGVNINKTGITLDLSNQRGRDILRELVRRGDALVENYSPRVMANLGLTDEVLWSWKPDLVILSMPAFGLDSPWRDYVGFAPTIEQMSGLPNLVGYRDGPPSLSGNSLADPIAGYSGAFALLCAMHQRSRTGQGQHVDLSQLEALTSLLGQAILASQFIGSAAARSGNARQGDAPSGSYAARGEDAWVVLSVRTSEEFGKLCEVLGRDDLVADPRFATSGARTENWHELDAIISDWSSRLEPLAAATKLQQAGVIAGPVLGPASLLDDQHLREREYWVELDRDIVGRHPHPGLPFKFSRTPGDVRESAPTLGRDNRRVLHDLLGMDDDMLARLESDHVIGTEPL